jgi:hypothetical protein
MKLKEIFEQIKKIVKPEKQVRPIDVKDPYATIKHKTKSIGFRHYSRHNNRKRTKRRNIQYVKVGRTSKPIYHSAY